jgi:cytochrome c
MEHCIMFRTWRASVVLLGVLAAAQEQTSSRAASRGKAVFEQCRGCHSAATGGKKVGPSLKGIFKRSRLRNGEAVTEKTVRSKIDLGGDGMPAYSGMLSENQKNDLIAYLKEL